MSVPFRGVIVSAGGVPGAGRMLTHAGPRLEDPFGEARVLEGDRVRAIPVEPAAPPQDIAFLDGIQRFSVDVWYGATPVIRAHVSAVALRRVGGELKAAVERRGEDLLVAPRARLDARQRAELDARPETVLDCEEAVRPHPVYDVQLAVKLVERRREAVERGVATEYRASSPEGWLVVDGPVTAHGGLAGDPRLVGIIKSHDTQYLDGDDAVAALTLPAGHRSSVFAPGEGARVAVHSWYLRLWPREGQDITHGLVRVERWAGGEPAGDAARISAWLLGERVPLAAPDARWDRLLYPIHRVEEYLRARAGRWG